MSERAPWSGSELVGGRAAAAVQSMANKIRACTASRAWHLPYRCKRASCPSCNECVTHIRFQDRVWRRYHSFPSPLVCVTPIPAHFSTSVSSSNVECLLRSGHTPSSSPTFMETGICAASHAVGGVLLRASLHIRGTML